MKTERRDFSRPDQLVQYLKTGAMEKSLSSTSGQAQLIGQQFFKNPRSGLFVRKLSS
jgi:hypothetical protein